ncbi:unnamed protein product [Effrenium voratum]|nr:unnamed protein product [Effrenium voratum]
MGCAHIAGATRRMAGNKKDLQTFGDCTFEPGWPVLAIEIETTQRESHVNDVQEDLRSRLPPPLLQPSVDICAMARTTRLVFLFLALTGVWKTAFLLGQPPVHLDQEPRLAGASVFASPTRSQIPGGWTPQRKPAAEDLAGTKSPRMLNTGLASMGEPSTVETQVVSGIKYKFSFDNGDQVTVWSQPWLNKLAVVNVHQTEP